MKKIILVRHGQSEGNISRAAYTERPDYAIRLTKEGMQQAVEAGKRIKDYLNGKPCESIVSSYFRTRQTFAGISKSVTSERVWFSELIREQEWANGDIASYNKFHEDRRDLIGSYYYRFPDGESVADCSIRAKLFLEQYVKPWETYGRNPLLVVTHGMMMRVLYKEIMHMSVEEFGELRNAKNCEFWALDISNLKATVDQNHMPRIKKRKLMFNYDVSDLV